MGTQHDDGDAQRLHGGRRTGLSRAVREHSQAVLSQDPAAAPVEFEDTVRRLSRRQLLAAGGGLGAAALLAGYGLRTGSARAAGKPVSDARVVIVGAGLAGVSAAYQLHRAGVRVELYEARDRLGGRCWTSKGWVDGQIAEHGGEFIDSRHVHIRQLARQLGLELDDLYAAKYGDFSPNWVRGRNLKQHEINRAMEPVNAAATAEAKRVGVIRPDGSINQLAITYPTATAAAKLVDRATMAEWLEDKVPGLLHSDVGEWLDQTMTGWYGLNMDRLSALNWIDFLIIPSPGADERWHVRGGNDQVIHRAVGTLPQGRVHRETVLRSIRRRAGGSYELDFDGVGRPVVADLVILTLPFTTLRDVDMHGAGFSDHKRAAIAQLAMGQDSKLMLQYDVRPWKMHDWSATMTSSDPDFDTWESSAMEAGKAGLITVYAGGDTSVRWRGPTPHAPATPQLRNEVLDRINAAIPGSKAHFNGRAVRRSVVARPVDAGQLRSVRAGSVHALLGPPRQGRGRRALRRRGHLDVQPGLPERRRRERRPHRDRGHEEAGRAGAEVPGAAALLPGVDSPPHMAERIALVTGASSGIGREAALALARAGMRVVGVARRGDRLAELAGDGIEACVADLASEDGCRLAVEETERRFGRVDVLVHSAGIGSSKERPVWRSDPDVWRETMAVNLDATYHLMRFATGGMVERGWGRVVVVSSTAGIHGGPSEPAYDASKHGVVGLVRASALDLAPYAVTCNAVLPGWVRTEMAERSAEATARHRGITADDVWAERDASYAAGRIPTVEEIAATIAFLCSDGASGISGEALSVALGDLW